MNMKKIFAILLSVMLVFALCACEADSGNTTTPAGSATPGTGNNNVPSVQCTITVMVKDGAAIAGVSLTLTKDGEEVALVTGDDGTATAQLKVGKYSISYDSETLPEACSPDSYELEVTESSTAITIYLTDNTPDGSSEKPFFITESITAINLVAGGEAYYNYRGAASKKIQINSDNVSVTYKDQVYTPVDGVVTVQLEPEIGVITSFSVKNTSDSAVETTMELISPLGSMDNPIVMEQNKATAVVPADGVVCYKWVSAKDGVIVVSSENETNNISMVNMTTNAVSAQTGGSYCEYMPVSAGDEVVISVSATTAGKEANIDFSVATYQGTETDVIPVLKDNFGLSFGANASFVFSANAGKTLKITDDSVSVTYNGKTYTPDALGMITVVLEGNAGDTVTFSITNTADGVNGIDLKVE